MTLRVAFCGPNMELCDGLAYEAKELIYGESMDVVLLPNPLREVLDLTHRTKFEGHDLDWMNLWTTSFRRVMMEGSSGSQVVVSGSCGLDQLAIQATWLGEQMNAYQSGLVIADATGQVHQPGEVEAMVNRSGAVVQVLLNSSEEEVVGYWDFVYAVMPASSGLSGAPNEVISQYSDFLASVPAFAGIVRLPDNKEAAVDALTNEVAKWKVKLNSS